MLFEFLFEFVLVIIQQLGYIGVFLLMLLESTMAPVPSELVMPFAGFLAAQGVMDFWLVMIVATLGSITGSLISYWIGRVLEHETILKFGKFFLINKHDLDIAHEWFNKYGGMIIFACRFVPAVRHVISIPAGFAEMDLKKFIVFTAAGAFLWNLILAYAGVILQENWTVLNEYFSIIDVFVIVAIIAVGALFIWKKLRVRNSR